MTKIPDWELPAQPEPDADMDPAITRFEISNRKGLVTGTGLGKYHILERICETHNGAVYKARDVMLDRLVRLKQLSRSLIDDPVACGEFKREAQLLARLSGRSRNVTHVYELISDEHGFFIAEEYIEGDYLETQISKRQFAASHVPQLIRHGCLALGALHAERVVHRDAWPGNWLVGANGRLILTNFSTATREGDTSPPPLVHAKYVSPEILLGEPCDCRADLYTFGMILYEVCVGRALMKSWCDRELGSSKPHEADWRAWHVDVSKRLPRADELNPDVPEAIARLIEQLTAKDIDDRVGSYQDALRVVNRQLAAEKTPTPALEQTGANILEIRRIDTGTARLPAGGTGSLGWLVREDQTTTTTKAITGTAPKGIAASRRRRGRIGSTASQPIDRPRLVPSREIQRAQEEVIRRRLPQKPVMPPPPADVPAARRVRPSIVIGIAASIVLLLSAVFAGYQVFVAVGDPGDAYREIATLIEAGEQARVDDDFGGAMSRLREAKVLAEGDSAFRDLYEQANRALMLVDAEKAATADEFTNAEASLSLAEQVGASPAVVAEIRDLIRSRRDARRIREESESHLRNQKFTKVEIALPEYRENAERAGLDPDALQRKLDESRAEQEYRTVVGKAEEAMKNKDFEAALISARDARRLKDTPESRRLVDRIFDAKRADDHRIRGDQAMADNDFTEAENEYRAGIEILPDVELEDRLRKATAGRLFMEATDALKAGDLLGCQRLLRNSLWQVRSNEAREMLERLTPAFEAANMVRNADHAIAQGDKESARRLLESAIPLLPSPAREVAQAKLDRLNE